MKSFGVRLAAGAVTILFGAYAAALAQRDKQNSSDSWSAQPTELGEPAVPIADISEETWLSQPSDGGPSDGRPSSGTNTARAFADGAVQLVQHTEPVDNETSGVSAAAFDASMLPTSLGDENGSAASGSATADDSGPATASIGVPDWTLPPQGDSQEPAAPSESASPAMTMSLPAELPGNEADLSGGGEPAGGLPELQLGGAPDMEFFPAESSGGASATASNTNAQESPASDLSANGQPANMLRGADAGVNALRGGAGDGATPTFSGGLSAGSDVNPNASLAENSALPQSSALPQNSAPAQTNPLAQHNTRPTDVSGAMSQTPQNFAQPIRGGMAQDAAGFAQSAQQFDQPAAMAAGAMAAGTQSHAGAQDRGQPYDPATQYNGAPGRSGQYNGAGTDRIASLPGSVGGMPQQNPKAYPANGGYGNPMGSQPQTFEQPAIATAIDPNATVASPGDRRLEGVQTPSIVIQKRAPSEVKVGKPASFVIHVQNVGTVEALEVVVNDRIPAGMELIDASPAPTRQGNLLLWQLGAMPAGEERTVTMQLLPQQEGELGSVARVSFEAAASVRTISTRPQLKIIQRVPEHGVLIGQQLEIELEVSNPGTGEATGVVLQEDVPEGLEHPKGRQLDNAIGTLAPGEVRRQVLRMRAVSPGIIQNTIRLTADDGLIDENTATVQVIAPDLQVELAGPSRRFLERQTDYQLNIANAGTADATNVEITVQLDRGFTFVSTGNEGQYDPSRHVVHWSLAQLPAGAQGSVPLTLLPVEEGEQAITVDARADLGMLAKNEIRTTVEAFAELSFSITNPGGPIELGSETSYEIKVNNSGSKADSNVQVQLQLPPELELVSADGDAQHDGRGLVAFQPRAQLAQGSEFVYRVRVRGVAPGTHLVRAVVVSDQRQVPVTKEESTLVYADK